jgi:D-alanyl-D-alanine carboxypeptidase (penicillin-binding protein 5/6)
MKRKDVKRFKFSRILIFLSLPVLPILFQIPNGNPYDSEKLFIQEPLVNQLSLDLPSPAPYPSELENVSPPNLTAASALVMDLDSGRVLYEKEPYLSLPPASTTKIMTAVVALETYQLSDVLTVKNLKVTGNVMGLKEGEKISVQNLLYGLLIKSGNDAAYVLAASHPKGYEQFIYSMNKKAESLNMFNTHFSNSSGLPDKNHYTSVRDFSLLTVYALKNPIINEMIKIKKITVSSVDSQFQHYLENTNLLLGHLGVDGVKTGWTQEAKQCLVVSATRGGHRVIGVIFNSEDRFGEASSLLNYVFARYRW